MSEHEGAEAMPDRCPLCGEGAFVEIAYDVDPSSREPAQRADSREIVTYSCGHSVAGPSLADADQRALDVARRATGDTVPPLPA